MISTLFRKRAPSVSEHPPEVPLVAGVDRTYKPHEFDEGENYWAGQYDSLRQQGYILRPRYRPGWKPSWPVSCSPDPPYEDAIRLNHSIICDATRIRDGVTVMLKRIHRHDHPSEVKIAEWLSARADPKNHCVPIYETLMESDDIDAPRIIIAMPVLRGIHDPRFDTFGEVVDFLKQIFEGVEFMHNNGVAHRDLMLYNIMMDAAPMYPNSWHPMAPTKNRDGRGKAKHYTRTQRPPRYHIVDFGISTRFTDPPPHSIKMREGADKSVPEFQNAKEGDKFDPYSTDVYYVGNMISWGFIKARGHGFTPASLGFEFIAPLVADMTQEDPSKRPTITQVIQQFDIIVGGMSTSKLRSRVVYTDEWPVLNLPIIVTHWARRLKYTLFRVPAIPQQIQPEGNAVDK